MFTICRNCIPDSSHEERRSCPVGTLYFWGYPELYSRGAVKYVLSSVREYCAVENGDSILLSRLASLWPSWDSPSVTSPRSTAKPCVRQLGDIQEGLPPLSVCYTQHTSRITLDSPTVFTWRHLLLCLCTQCDFTECCTPCCVLSSTPQYGRVRRTLACCR